MFCKKCGYELKNDDDFCPKCGVKKINTSHTAIEPDENPNEEINKEYLDSFYSICVISGSYLIIWLLNWIFKDDYKSQSWSGFFALTTIYALIILIYMGIKNTLKTVMPLVLAAMFSGAIIGLVISIIVVLYVLNNNQITFYGWLNESLFGVKSTINTNLFLMSILLVIGGGILGIFLNGSNSSKD